MGKRRGKSVLCIGNDPVHLNFRCSLLREHGWIVHSSGGGHEGIRLFGQEKVDAVVLDFDDDRAEAALIAGELKRQRPDVPVIMLVTDGEGLAEGATQQANAVVSKLEDGQVLLDTLKAVLRLP